MSDCSQGQRNQDNIDKLFDLLEKRNQEAVASRIEIARQSEMQKSMQSDLKDIKALLISDSAKRTERCEQLVANTKDIKTVKENEKAVNKRLISLVFVVILAIIKTAFFKQ